MHMIADPTMQAHGARTEAAKLPAHWTPSMMNTPWVESPFFDELLAESALTDAEKEQARHFAEEGYLIVDTAIAETVLDAAVRDVGTRTDAPSQCGQRLQDANSGAVRSIAGNPGIIALLRMLYRREPIAFQTLNFQKGTEQPIHSDAIHFHSIPARFLCGVWVALEDIDDDNGPLVIYPQSHRLPTYDMHDIGAPTGIAAYHHCYETFAEALMRAHDLSARHIHLRKGQAVFWAANLHHGGSPVRDRERTRWSQVTHYFFQDSCYYTPLCSDAAIGILALRSIHDLITGEPVPNLYRGKPLPPEPHPQASQPLMHRLMRAVQQQLAL